VLSDSLPLTFVASIKTPNVVTLTQMSLSPRTLQPLSLSTIVLTKHDSSICVSMHTWEKYCLSRSHCTASVTAEE
jgi:hypothetical protein